VPNTSLPKDPVILLSYINTLLRDEYSSLSSLCEDRQVDEEELQKTLSSIGYEYDSTLNRFR
jgi:hypothetical protein